MWSQLLISLAGLVAAAGAWLFPVNPPAAGVHPNCFVAQVRVERPGTTQFWYDIGAGNWNELSQTRELAPSKTPVTLSFPLPSGTIVGFLWALPGGSASLIGAQVRDCKGRTVYTFAPDDLLPNAVLRLRGRLLLPAAPGPGSRVVARERWIAAGLFVAECAIVVLIWRLGGEAASRPWLSSAVVLLAAASVLFSRRPDVFAHPQFWAEDGTVYFPHRGDGWGGLFETQANYLVLIPRATALLANLAPVWYAPIIYTGVAVVVTLLTVALAASPRVGLPFRFWAALLVVLVPAMDEITSNITNVQWFGAVILVLVAVSRPPGNRRQVAGDLALIVLFGLTGPFVVMLLPVFFWRAWRSQARAAWLAAALTLCLSVWQVEAYRSSSPQPVAARSAPLTHFLAAAGYRTGGQLFGLMPSPDFTNPVPWGIAGLILMMLIWLAFPVRTPQGPIRWALAWAGALVMAGGFVKYSAYCSLFFEPVFILRYFYLPVLFTGWVLLAGLERRGLRRYAAAALLALAAADNRSAYRMEPYTDLHWPHYAAAIERGLAVKVPINPPAWSFYSPGRPGR